MAGVQIGLSDLHYAILQSDTTSAATYETPVRIPGVITANINPNSSTDTLFADDGPSETAATLGQIELELSVSDLPLDVQAALLGHTLDANGILVRKANDVPPWVAVGFKSLKSNGKYRFLWLLKGKFSVPELNHETKGDSINFQAPTINANFVQRDFDQAWIRQTDEDATGYTPTTGDTWFDSVG